MSQTGRIRVVGWGS